MRKIDFDVDYNQERASRWKVFDLIKEHGGRVISYQQVGPGGGNPNYVAEFPCDADARSFLGELYGTRDPAYLDCHFR